MYSYPVLEMNEMFLLYSHIIFFFTTFTTCYGSIYLRRMFFLLSFIIYRVACYIVGITCVNTVGGLGGTRDESGRVVGVC